MGSEASKTYPFDLTLIIVSWNVRDYLGPCLRSVAAMSAGLAMQIIVVDNGSSDGTPEMLADEFPDVQLIASAENLGFGRAHNLAVPAAHGRYLALLNPDTLLLNDVFGQLVGLLDARPEIGIAGPKLVAEDGRVEFACARRLATLGSELRVIAGIGLAPGRATSTSLPPAAYEYSQPVECVSGACLVMRRDLLVAGNIFDPRFFMYAEDIDLCFEAAVRGLGVYYLSEARVLHYGGASSSQQSQTALGYTIDAKQNYLAKRYGARSAQVYLGAMAFVLTIKYAIARTMSSLPIHPGAKARWSRQAMRYHHMVKTASALLVGGR